MKNWPRNTVYERFSQLKSVLSIEQATDTRRGLDDLGKGSL